MIKGSILETFHLLIFCRYPSLFQPQIKLQPGGVPYVVKSSNELLHPNEIYFTRCGSESENVCISWDK